MKQYAIIAILALSCAALHAQSAMYPFPSKWSYQDVASWSLPRPKIVETLPSVGDARTGDLVFLTNDDEPPFLYRNSGSAWVSVGESASSSGGSGEFFRFMNVATVPFSIPIIGRMGSWTTTPFPLIASVGMSLSNSPLCFDPQTGQLTAIIASSGPRIAVGAESPVFWPNVSFDGEYGLVYNKEYAFDGDYDTFATIWYDPAGGASGYPGILAEPWYNRLNVTGLAIMFSKNHYILPTQFKNGWVASGTPVKAGGEWAFSPFGEKNYYGYTYVFQPSTVTATTPWDTRWRRVEIAEARLVDYTASPTSPFGQFSYPRILPLLHPDPASATFDGFVVRGQTATPTARVVGTLWVDINLSPPRIKVWNGNSWSSL